MVTFVGIVVLLLAAGAVGFRGFRRWAREAWQWVVVAALLVAAILYIGIPPLARTKKG